MLSNFLSIIFVFCYLKFHSFVHGPVEIFSWRIFILFFKHFIKLCVLCIIIFFKTFFVPHLLFSVVFLFTYFLKRVSWNLLMSFVYFPLSNFLSIISFRLYFIFSQLLTNFIEFFCFKYCLISYLWKWYLFSCVSFLM